MDGGSELLPNTVFGSLRATSSYSEASVSHASPETAPSANPLASLASLHPDLQAAPAWFCDFRLSVSGSSPRLPLHFGSFGSSLRVLRARPSRLELI